MGGLTALTATLTAQKWFAVSSISLISSEITALTALTADPEPSPITETCLYTRRRQTAGQIINRKAPELNAESRRFHDFS
jgi:hypothetical protein